MRGCSALVDEEQWTRAQNVGRTLRVVLTPLFQSSIANTPEVVAIRSRLDGLLELSRTRENVSRRNNTASSRGADARRETLVGRWRDTPSPSFSATLTLTDLGDGRSRMTFVYGDGSTLVQQLREAQPRSTDRRRWEEVGDEHSYAIRQSDGALDLFDNQGYIRTAQSIR